MADRNVKVILAASVEGFTAAMGRAKASVETLGAATAKASQTEGWRRAGTAMIGLGAAAMAGVAMAVRASASFEQSMAEVAATGEEARGQIAGLRKAALDAGRDTAFSATEAADGITALAKAGVSTADILSGGLRGALDLAASGQLSVADAAETASAALVQFKLKGKDAGHVADLLAAGAGKAMGSVGDMGQALKQSGVVASQFGVSIEETVGTLAAFASTGMIGAEAGTGFKSMLLALAKPSKDAQRTMDDLGIAAYDAQGQFVGITDLAGQLKDKLGGLTVEQRQAALSTIFGSFAIRNASVLYEQGAEGIQQWVNNVNDSGYAARVAAGLLDNLNGDLQVLGGSWETLLIKMGTDAQAPLRGVVQWMTELINAVAEHPTMAASVLKLLAAFGGFALAAGLVMKATTATVEFRNSLGALRAEHPKVVGALGKIGKVAGAVGLSFAGLEIASTVFEKLRAGQPTLEQTSALMLQLAASTESAAAAMSRQDFAAQTSMGWQKIELSVEGAFEQLKKWDDLRNGSDPLAKIFAGMSANYGALKELEAGFRRADQALGQMVGTGHADKAAAAFARMAEAAKKQGVDNDSLIRQFPTYAEGLRAQASALAEATGYTDLLNLSNEDLVRWMGGDIPIAVRSAQIAAKDAGSTSEALTKQQKELSAATDTATRSYDEYVNSLFAANNAAVAMLDAQLGFNQSVLDGSKAAKEWAEKVAGGHAQAKSAFDRTTEAGIANNRVMLDMVSNAQRDIEERTKQGESIESIIAIHGQYRDQMIKVATQYLGSRDAAVAYIDQLFKTPKNISTAVQLEKSAADARLKQWKTKLDGVPDTVRTSILAAVERGDLATANRLLADAARTRTATIKVHVSKDGREMVGGGNRATINASGGLYTDRANGHLPQIARAGDWRIWAEPETGGEAYIPLANDWRRPRAQSILRETASLIGMRAFAGGGISHTSPALDTSGISAAVADGLSGARIYMVDPTSGVERLVDARIEAAGRRSASTVRRR